MKRLRPFAVGLALAGTFGWAQQPVPPARDEAGQAVSGFSSNGDTQLNDYMRMALDRNPGLSRALAQYRSVLQRLPQVSALPDPMLAFTNYLRTPETRVGSQTNAVTLSQQFPWFGTLGMREQVAAKETARYRQQYEAAKDQVVRQVKTAYYSLAFIDLALDINDEERLLLDHYEKLAESRYQQGAGLRAGRPEVAGRDHACSNLQSLKDFIEVGGPSCDTGHAAEFFQLLLIAANKNRIRHYCLTWSSLNSSLPDNLMNRP